MSKSDRIRNLLARGLSIKEIAKRLKVTTNLVYQVKWQAERKKKAQPERSHDPKVVKAEKKYIKAVKTNTPSKIIKAVKEMKQALDVIEKPKATRKDLLNEIKPGLDALFGNKVEKKPTKLIIQPQFAKAALDLINNPPHYRVGGVETIDFIEAKDLNYRLGNVVKYVSRAGKKGDPLQDLEKAAWYLQREIATRKSA